MPQIEPKIEKAHIVCKSCHKLTKEHDLENGDWECGDIKIVQILDPPEIYVKPLRYELLDVIIPPLMVLVIFALIFTIVMSIL